MKKLCLLLALVMMLLCGCGGKSASTTCPPHKDDNDDGLCDVCRSVVVISVDFYAINDLHGKIADGDSHPGVDELSTYLNNAKSASNNVILLSSGDMWQGAPESNMTEGLLVTDWMNQMGFASMTLGNHEYDWGSEAIRKNAELAEFPLLAINVYDKETRQRVDYCDSSVMVDLGDVQIGIIGAMGDCYSSIASDKTEDIYFLTGAQLSALVIEESQKLRDAGADFIVYSIHDGYDRSSGGSQPESVSRRDISSYYDVALSDGYVDLVFEAHTHQSYVLQDEHGVYHLQGGGDNKGITYASAVINTVTGTSQVMSHDALTTGEYSRLEDDPVVQQLMDKYDEQVAPAFEIVGTNSRLRNRYELQQLAADLYRDAGVEKWGNEYDIVLGGGFLSCRSPNEMKSGEITYGLLQSLFPFDNEIVLCSIKGRELVSKFIETDHYAYYMGYTPYGENLVGNVDPDATYYVVTDTFSANYAPNKMTVIESYGENIFARDLIADYMGEGGLA